MANEITVSATLKCLNGDFSYSRKISGQQYTQTAQGGNGGVQEIGFGAHEAVDLGDLATEGYSIFRNLDGTNFLELGVQVAAAFEPFVRLEPGEIALFRISQDAGATPYAQADTAACNLEYFILED